MNEDKIKTIYNCELCDKKPCLVGCPLDNDIQSAIKYALNKDYENSFKTFSNTTVLMSICGRVCPFRKQCEGSCVKRHTRRKVKIGRIESTIGDLALENGWNIDIPKKTKYNVAIVGGGPAGLTCAAFLRRNGIGVTIYEKHNYLGGLLVHGIPDFRLSKEIVKSVIDNIVNLGINVIYEKELGKNLNLIDLTNEYDAVFIGIGANVSNKMHIPGEKLKGVYGGNELLEKNIQIDFKDKVVVVSGGGDVSVDVARTIIRKGAKKVSIVYRRSENVMPADLKEIKLCKKEGIEIIGETNILKINGKDKVNSVDVVKTKVSADNLGNVTIDNMLDTKYKLLCDYVIMAVGSHPESYVKKFDLDMNKKGKIVIDKDGHTSNEKVFSGGDVTLTKSTVAWASRAGRNAAYSIIKYLDKNDNCIEKRPLI